MNKLLVVITALWITCCGSLSAQGLPPVTVEDLDGNKVDFQTVENDGKPIVVSFWAIWCKPCLKELKAISEVYEDWQDETGVKLIAISIDDERSSRMVPSIVKWEFLGI